MARVYTRKPRSFLAAFSGPLSSLLTPPVALYITSQRNRLTKFGTPLSESFRTTFRAYFQPVDLDRVRIAERVPLPIPALPFQNAVRGLGWDFLASSAVAAITLDHIIASRELLTPELLFHELVHAVQFRLLGVKKFARLYVHGFLLTRSYHEIPLERCAFDLGYRFESGRTPFDVEREVSEWLARHL